MNCAKAELVLDLKMLSITYILQHFQSLIWIWLGDIEQFVNCMKCVVRAKPWSLVNGLWNRDAMG